MEVTLIGRRLAARSVGLLTLGMADKIAKKSSTRVSPSHTHYYKQLQIKLARSGLARSTARVGTSIPKVPGDARLFIFETVLRSSVTVKGAFNMS
jgi:hypothetical protein